MQTWSGLVPRDRTMEFAAIAPADLPPPAPKARTARSRGRPPRELRLILLSARELGAIA